MDRQRFIFCFVSQLLYEQFGFVYWQQLIHCKLIVRLFYWNLSFRLLKQDEKRHNQIQIPYMFKSKFQFLPNYKNDKMPFIANKTGKLKCVFCHCCFCSMLHIVARSSLSGLISPWQQTKNEKLFYLSNVLIHSSKATRASNRNESGS